MDIGRIDLDGVSDSGVNNGIRATTIWSLLSSRCDQLGSLFGEWQCDTPNAVDIKTRVWTPWNDHRSGERAGELNLVFQDVTKVVL